MFYRPFQGGSSVVGYFICGVCFVIICFIPLLCAKAMPQ